MKSLFSLLIICLIIIFVFCSICGSIMAVIDIVRDPSRHKKINSADVVPDDFLEQIEEDVPEQDVAPEVNKKIIV